MAAPERRSRDAQLIASRSTRKIVARLLLDWEPPPLEHRTPLENALAAAKRLAHAEADAQGAGPVTQPPQASAEPPGSEDEGPLPEPSGPSPPDSSPQGPLPLPSQLSPPLPLFSQTPGSPNPQASQDKAVPPSLGRRDWDHARQLAETGTGLISREVFIWGDVRTALAEPGELPRSRWLVIAYDHTDGTHLVRRAAPRRAACTWDRLTMLHRYRASIAASSCGWTFATWSTKCGLQTSDFFAPIHKRASKRSRRTRRLALSARS